MKRWIINLIGIVLVFAIGMFAFVVHAAEDPAKGEGRTESKEKGDGASSADDGEAAKEPAAPAKGDTTDEKASEGGDGSVAGGKQGKRSEAKGAGPPVAPEKPQPECDAPSAEELSILRGLRARRLLLEAREVEVERREKLLAEIERGLERKVRTALDAIAEIEKKIEVGRAEREAREEKLNSLAASLAGLSPPKAAPILEASDPDLAAMLLVRLDNERSGALLAKMEPRRAAALMERLVLLQTPAQRAWAKTPRQAPDKEARRAKGEP